MSYNKTEVKEQLELEDIYMILDYFNAEPEIYNNYIVAKTICHNGESHKLYYYSNENSGLFKCYSGDCGTFDIFELVQKVQGIDDLNQAIYYVVNLLNLQNVLSEIDDDYTSLEDWKIFNRYNKVDNLEFSQNKKVELSEIDKKILEHFPQPQINNWIEENISKEVCDYMNIRYNPVTGCVLIPHEDENDRLIGIRQRTLIKDDEIYGKYKPTKIGNKMYNHPLAFNLYGLNKAKSHINDVGVAIVLESEKSVLQFISYFGVENDLAVGVCGSSISAYQFQLLLDCGMREMVVGFDKDFQELGSEDFNTVVNKLQKLYNKYGNLVNVSFLFDKHNLLGYKDSPTDCGKDAFLYLFRNRIVL